MQVFRETGDSGCSTRPTRPTSASASTASVTTCRFSNSAATKASAGPTASNSNWSASAPAST
ncbi:hypothetical protein IPC1268_06660, partial [Pseudomonas aeruginosa]